MAVAVGRSNGDAMAKSTETLLLIAGFAIVALVVLQALKPPTVVLPAATNNNSLGELGSLLSAGIALL